MFETVIGLEVHARLATNTKLFCSCSASYGAQANTHACEVCAGMPGALPVTNAKAVEYAVRAGLAVGSTICKESVFARKNYFYPDLPSGYQISQFEAPICDGGEITINVDGKEKIIKLTRIHLENDAGKNIHGDINSFVDVNRAGTPLIEIVSEPDMRGPEEAVAYLKELYSIITSLGICDGNMEEGSFKCDVNVSIRPFGQEEFGTRTELKNINSFRHIQKAIEYEVQRQKDAIEDGIKIVQETRLYDSNKNITLSMRSKEEAHDYRYFPDPDLLPLYITDEQIAQWEQTQPELPKAKTARFMQSYALNEEDAKNLCSDKYLSELFEKACAIYNEPRKILNYIFGALQRELNNREISSSPNMISPEALAELVKIVDSGLISAKIANDIFSELFASELMPEALVKEKGLVQVSDVGALEQAVDEVLASNPAEVEAFKGGKTKLMGFFVGQVMRQMKGKANPSLLNEILAKKLS